MLWLILITLGADPVDHGLESLCKRYVADSEEFRGDEIKRVEARIIFLRSELDDTKTGGAKVRNRKEKLANLKDQIAYENGRLETLHSPRHTPPVTFSILDSVNSHLGSINEANVRVRQIVDAQNMVVEFEDHPFWIQYFPTKSLADGVSIDLTDCVFETGGGRSYTTVLGAKKTIPLLRFVAKKDAFLQHVDRYKIKQNPDLANPPSDIGVSPNPADEVNVKPVDPDDKKFSQIKTLMASAKLKRNESDLKAAMKFAERAAVLAKGTKFQEEANDLVYTIQKLINP